MFKIYYILKPNGSPIDVQSSNATTVDEAREEADRHISDKLAGPSKGTAGIGYAIEDATGTRISTWFNGKQVD